MLSEHFWAKQSSYAEISLDWPHLGKKGKTSGANARVKLHSFHLVRVKKQDTVLLDNVGVREVICMVYSLLGISSFLGCLYFWRRLYVTVVDILR